MDSLQQQCPSCGAPILNKRTYFAIYVCEYCQSHLCRVNADGGVWESLGKIPEPLADASPLQIGTTGEFQNKKFEIKGRLQFFSEGNTWNEWFATVLNSPHSSNSNLVNFAWIGDFMGLYTFSSILENKTELNNLSEDNFSKLVPGKLFFLGSTEFMVLNRDEGICHTGEGELPFPVLKPEPFESIDCRSHKAEFLGINVLKPVEVYKGYCGYFADFNFKSVRNFEGEFSGWK
jgi:Domain of unknown function (DUF4178)